MFNIIDELSTSVQEANLEEIWKRTLNTKPTLGVRIKAFFKPTAISNNLQKQYKDIFTGWFLREIELMREIIDKKDEIYIKLQWLKSELKIIHNINEIEEMYNQFMLIRRSENV